MTLPIPSEFTAAAGQVLTAAAWNSNVRDAVNYLLNPPIFYGYQTVAQSIPTAAFTACAFDAEIVDPYGGHSTSTNNSRYIAQVAGYYLVDGQCGVVGNATGVRALGIFVNGSAVAPIIQPESAPNAALTTILQTVGFVFLNVGDYVEVRMDQTSGGALNTVPNATSMSCLWVHQ